MGNELFNSSLPNQLQFAFLDYGWKIFLKKFHFESSNKLSSWGRYHHFFNSRKHFYFPKLPIKAFFLSFFGTQLTFNRLTLI